MLRDPSKARGLFYMRDPSFERSVPHQHLAAFEAESFDSAQRMEKLKGTIRESIPPECCYDYSCSWKGVVDGKVCAAPAPSLDQGEVVWASSR